MPPTSHLCLLVNSILAFKHSSIRAFPPPSPRYPAPVPPTPLQTELWLIRHGESLANISGVIHGQDDSPLSPHGQVQVRLLAARLATCGATRLVASTLRRAQETAAALVATTGLTVEFEPRLREVSVGTWEGRTAGEIAAAEPAAWARWEARDPDLPLGGAETYRDAIARCTAALQDIAVRHRHERILVVGHGGVLRGYLAGVLGLDLRQMWRLALDNTSISRVRPFQQVMGGPDQLMGRVQLINDTAHLEDR